MLVTDGDARPLTTAGPAAPTADRRPSAVHSPASSASSSVFHCPPEWMFRPPDRAPSPDFSIWSHHPREATAATSHNRFRCDYPILPSHVPHPFVGQRDWHGAPAESAAPTYALPPTAMDMYPSADLGPRVMSESYGDLRESNLESCYYLATPNDKKGHVYNCSHVFAQ